MPTAYNDMIRDSCEPLFAALSAQPGAPDAAVVERLGVRTLGLARVKGYQLGGQSTLTASGHPIMVSAQGEERLMVVDPAWCLLDPHERLLAARSILTELLYEQEMVRLREHYDRLVRALLTCDPKMLERRGQGLIHLAVDAANSRLRVGAHLEHLRTVEAWGLLSNWLEDLMPHDPPPCHWLRALRAARFSPRWLGLSHHQGRPCARLELVRHEPVAARLDVLPELLDLRDDRLQGALTALLEQPDIDAQDELVSLEIDLERRQLRKLSYELASRDCCEGYQWVRDMQHHLDLNPAPLALLERDDLHLERIGLMIAPATEGAEGARLEWSMRLHARERIREINCRPVSQQLIERQMERAISALLARQQSDGHWHDMSALPFGDPSIFVTSFVSLALTRAPRHQQRAWAAARRGTQWLDIMRDTEDGWGFGPHAGADAMTTSLALRAFIATDHVISPRDREWLLGRWSRHEGGFSFAQGPLHWGDVHPCVTALAWPVLAPEQRDELSLKFHDYLANFATERGAWHAYWWRTHHFSTYHHLALFSEETELRDQFIPMRSALEVDPEQATTFELAWACAAAARAQFDDLAIRLGHQLLRRQQVDGSWRGSADLRITSPACACPWLMPQGQLIEDELGCITTASALWALSELSAVCASREDRQYL